MLYTIPLRGGRATSCRSPLHGSRAGLAHLRRRGRRPQWFPPSRRCRRPHSRQSVGTGRSAGRQSVKKKQGCQVLQLAAPPIGTCGVADRSIG